VGLGGGYSSAGDARIQIVPVGIEFLNQPDFPGSIPLLQLLLALDRVFGIIELFEIDEVADLVLLRKAFRQFQAMLGDAANEIIGYADVKRAPIRLARM
jgi:hypothetical protein